MGGTWSGVPFTGKASFLLFRNDALKLAHLLAEAEQNNAILRLDDGLAGRDERLAAPDDPEQKYPLGQAKLMHTLPGDKGFLIHQSLEHFSGVAAHGDAGKHLPLPDILQNTVHGGQAGAHAVRDADGFHEGEVGGLVSFTPRDFASRQDRMFDSSSPVTAMKASI